VCHWVGAGDAPGTGKSGAGVAGLGAAALVGTGAGRAALLSIACGSRDSEGVDVGRVTVFGLVEADTRGSVLARGVGTPADGDGFALG
jgi:hypothetical protein